MPGQLSREDWIEAAIGALGRGGVQAVRVDHLARELGVTRGSFYWHFKGRDDLLSEILAAWEVETERLLESAGGAPDPEARLRRLVEDVKALGGRLPDAAIFLWARQDPEVARRVAAVEARRIGFLETCLRESGIEFREALRRAEMGYLTFVGIMDRSHRDPGWKPDMDGMMEALIGQMLGRGKGRSRG